MDTRIINRIGIPAMLEQTSEECAELTQACLKYARYIRGENPTPKQLEDILDNFFEEIADVELCIEYMESILNRDEIERKKRFKKERTLKRLSIEE